METSFGSVFLLLLLVIDPLGNVPITSALLRTVESPRRRRLVLLRECAIACWGSASLPSASPAASCFF